MSECKTCGGRGFVYYEVTNYVTREMALDACEPDMEGWPINEERESPCPDCDGPEKDGD
jgi:hypothetical protein